eukprot:g2387.t1
MTLVLIPSIGCPEILPASVNLHDVFSQVLLFTQPISELVTLHWHVSNARGLQLNEYGSSAAGCPVHGDMCITFSQSIDEKDLDATLLRLNGTSCRCTSIVKNSSRSEQYLSHLMTCTKKERAAQLKKDSLFNHHSIIPPKIVVKSLRSEDDNFNKKRSMLGLWDRLHPDLLSSILKNVLSSTRDLISISGVCSRWRGAVLQDATLLSNMKFTLNTRRPFLGSSKRLRGRHCKRIPKLLTKATTIDNVEALRCYAMLLDEIRKSEESHDIWHRLYRMGDIYGCWKMGEILYRRSATPDNRLNAFLAFSRASKKAMSMGDGPEKSLVLNKVGVYLGYFFVDGDGGQKQDNETAVYWFRLSAAHGNNDAMRALGWLFNTGMYG